MLRRLFALAIVLFPVVALAVTPGTATGKITFNGKAKDLKYAYAWKDPKSNEVIVVLTDTKLDDKVLADKFALIDAARKDKFTGVQVPISAKGDAGTGTFYTAAEDGYFDAGGMHKWEKKAQTSTSIEGKLSAPEGHFFKTSYSYSATFQAPISAAPKK
jgi:hypothetical protein